MTFGEAGWLWAIVGIPCAFVIGWSKGRLALLRTLAGEVRKEMANG